MSRITNSSRRLLLKMPLLATMATLLLSACKDGNEIKGEKAAAAMTNQLNYPEQAKQLGRAYLETHRDIASMTVGTLSLDILQRIGITPDNLPLPDSDTISEQLWQAIREDFTNENIAIVNGWMLSETEAKLCALVLKYSPDKS